ncbi:MAG: hypothetical protein K2K20_11485 [Lachnospiraceae bacterium]|nr:hypothetical protein [Lachnospiraceae bacterium]
MKKSILYLLFLIVFILSACSTTADSDNAELSVLAPETEMTITSNKTQVLKFVFENKNFTSDYDKDECFNITPDFILDNSEYAVFKYDTSAKSFIMYNGEVYSIGDCFGGFGITSMALADINMDGQYELYYTFSWGSGLHRSQIGYFDPVSREVTIFDYSYFGGPFSFLSSEMILTVNASGDLCVNSAIIDLDSFVDFSIKAQELIGTIVFDEDEITLKLYNEQ